MPGYRRDVLPYAEPALIGGEHEAGERVHPGLVALLHHPRLHLGTRRRLHGAHLREPHARGLGDAEREVLHEPQHGRVEDVELRDAVVGDRDPVLNEGEEALEWLGTDHDRRGALKSRELHLVDGVSDEQLLTTRPLVEAVQRCPPPVGRTCAPGPRVRRIGRIAEVGAEPRRHVVGPCGEEGRRPERSREGHEIRSVALERAPS